MRLLHFLPLVFALRTGCAEFTISSVNVTTGTDVAHEEVLRNTITGENVSIVLNMGGRVESLFLKQPSDGLIYDVLDNNRGNASAMLQPSGFRGLMLLPYANRIANHTYSWNGTRYYLPVNEPSRNNSIHGLLYNRTMGVVSRAVTPTAATLTLQYQFGDDVGYPFPLHVAIAYTLDDAGLTMQVNATNHDPTWPLPYYASWHSYFNVKDVAKSVVTVDDCTAWNHVAVDAGLIPTGATALWRKWDGSSPIGGNATVPTYYDDEVKSRGECSRYAHRITDGDVHAVLWGDRHYRYLQVYTGAVTRFHRNSVAMEAMNGQCNAFNRFHDGLHVISGGETFSSSFGVYLE